MKINSISNYTQILILALIVSILGIYSISLINNSTFFWDDKWILLNNPNIKSLSITNIIHVFCTSYSFQYSPLDTLYYAVIYHFWGMNPFVFHIASVLIHVSNTLLVFLFLHRLIKLKQNIQSEQKYSELTIVNLSFVISLLFGISPMQIESVAWISASKIVLYAFFFLISLIFYLNYLEKKKVVWLLGSCVSFLLSYASKEQAVVLPLMLILLDYYLFPNINRKSLLRLSPIIAVAFLLGVISINIQEFHTITNNNYYPLWQRVFLGCYAITQYLVKIIFPLKQSNLYPFPIQPGETLPYIFILYPLVILIIGYYLYKYFIANQKYIIFGSVFFFINLMLTLHFVPMGRVSIIADRYVYLSCIGIFYVIFTYIAEQFNKPLKKSQKILAIIGISLYILLVYTKSIVYIQQWDDYWLKNLL